MASATYLIGVDTGGTYTDAAVIEAKGHKVVASAKSITTKGDLSIGVSGAITAAIAALPRGLHPENIALVSVSTTLATNAVVEGHGSAVGVILIGFDQAMAERTGIAKAFPGMPMAMIAGGHDHTGAEAQPLDAVALEAAAAAMPVDAFAIASAFAVRNPAHEHAARDLVARVTGKPVTLSTELTSSLDAPRRALTAVLNARLISRISMLITAVRKSMAELGIDCPLMIVKGDGTLALAERVALRPIETVLSGPAASLVGASWLCGRRDFIMSDMGGTTTDLGVLRDGRPQVAEQGAEVGGWRTMVKAIDVRTIGLGGDSEIGIGLDGKLTVGPQRVAPVSLLASRYPEVIAMLEADLADTEGGSLHGRFVLRPFGATGSAQAAELAPRERELLAMIGERPLPLRKVAVSSAAQRALAALKRKGLVQTGGFTPSDAALVLGLQDNWPGGAARLAAQLLVRFREMKLGDDARVEAFCREVWSETVRLTCRVILDTAFGKSFGHARACRCRLLWPRPARPCRGEALAADPGRRRRRPGSRLLRGGRTPAGLRDRLPALLRCRQCRGCGHRRGGAVRHRDGGGRWQRTVPGSRSGRGQQLRQRRGGAGSRGSQRAGPGGSGGAPAWRRPAAGACLDQQEPSSRCGRRQRHARGRGPRRGHRPAVHRLRFTSP